MPIRSFEGFCRKSIFLAPGAFIFCKEWVLNEVNKWWKFGSDNSNHFEKSKIEYFVFSIPHLVGKKSSIFYLLGEELKKQNLNHQT